MGRKDRLSWRAKPPIRSVQLLNQTSRSWNTQQNMNKVGEELFEISRRRKSSVDRLWRPINPSQMVLCYHGHRHRVYAIAQLTLQWGMAVLAVHCDIRAERVSFHGGLLYHHSAPHDVSGDILGYDQTPSSINVHRHFPHGSCDDYQHGMSGVCPSMGSRSQLPRTGSLDTGCSDIGDSSSVIAVHAVRSPPQIPIWLD